MDNTVREAFDQIAAEYDELKLRIIPGYRHIQDMALRYAGPADRVLELGCGTGEWAAKYLEVHPEAEYRAIEFSDKMRELASARLAGCGHRFRLIEQDLNSALPAGPFDLVVAFFAIHHAEDKQRLFHEIFGRLSSEGRLIFADVTVAADPDLEQMFLDEWIRFMREAGVEEERVPCILEDHRDNDLPETKEQHLAYLSEAGFQLAEIVWSQEKFALFFAQKQ
jgi:ubiquinone/menaquinone biosynthesis C-methylase UbiE